MSAISINPDNLPEDCNLAGLRRVIKKYFNGEVDIFTKDGRFALFCLIAAVGNNMNYNDAKRELESVIQVLGMIDDDIGLPNAINAEYDGGKLKGSVRITDHTKGGKGKHVKTIHIEGKSKHDIIEEATKALDEAINERNDDDEEDD